MHPKQMSTLDQITMLKDLWKNHVKALEDLEYYLNSICADEMTNVKSPIFLKVADVEKCLYLRLGQESWEKR